MPPTERSTRCSRSDHRPRARPARYPSGMRYLCLLIIAACGSKPATTSTMQTESKPSPCTAMADHAVKAALGQQLPPDGIAAVTTIVRTRCDQDAWTAEAQACFNKAEQHD